MGYCICDWPAECCGTGIMMCDGCGGDLCVCRCGGEMECPGCPACMGLDDPGDWGEDAAQSAPGSEG